MKTIVIILTTTVITAGLSFVCFYYYWRNNPKLVVKEVKVYETKYIKVPKTPKELEDCYKSKLNIQVATNNDKVLIRAYDDCKEADAVATITAKKDIMDYVLTIGAGIVCGILIILVL